MKTYRPPLESNGCDSGFVKSALCVLEIDDKSSFSMSGHVGPLEALVQLRIRPMSSSYFFKKFLWGMPPDPPRRV